MRNKHPYYTYDAIIAQPKAIISVLTENEEKIIRLRGDLQKYKKIFLVGTGTSYHAAKAAQYFFSINKNGLSTQAVKAFNFSLYPPTLCSEDLVIVISHRGTKKYSLASLQLAKEKGARTILITGKSKEKKDDLADEAFYTVEQEVSGAHTISYSTSLAILASLADKNFDSKNIAKILMETLKLEDAMKNIANKIKDIRHIWIIGGGPSEVTAQEIALKIKETSYMMAEGMDTETFFHGPFQSIEPQDFIVLIAPDEKAKDRTLQLIPAINAIGANYLVIGNQNMKKEKQWYSIPETAESYTTFSCLIPLQLFAYHFALMKKTNPDSWRLDDPKFVAAEKHMKL